jgi:hypothetical protein
MEDYKFCEAYGFGMMEMGMGHIYRPYSTVERRSNCR